MTDKEESPKRGRPRKVVTGPMGYSKQVRINRLLHEFYIATEHKDGPAARKILDDLEELLESAIE
jgi:hypothetical protein